MKKILGFLGAFSLIVAPTITVVSCKKQKAPAKKTPPPTEPSSGLSPLNSVITYANMGSFDHAPTEAELLDKLKRKNVYLNLDEITLTIDSQVANKAVVKVNPDSKVYEQGSIDLIYRDPGHEKLFLHDEMKITDLGDFYRWKILTAPKSSGWSEFEKGLLYQLFWLNLATSSFRSVELKIVNYDLENGIASVSTVSNSTIYYDSGIVITFKYHQQRQINIENDFEVNDLGTIGGEDNVIDPDSFINRFLLLNPKIQTDQITIFNIALLTTKPDNNQIYLMVKLDSKVYTIGTTIFLKYKYKEFVKLKNDLTVTNLGNFTKEPTTEELVKSITDKNTNLNKDEVYISYKDISNNTAMITVNEHSQYYAQESIQVSWTVG